MSETPTPENDAPETVEVVRGWRTYRDGSTSPIERWVRHADGDWVSLDSNRRTSGDIQMDPQSLSRPPCPECGTGWCPGGDLRDAVVAGRVICTNCAGDDLGCTACGAHGTLAVTRVIPPEVTP